MVGRSLVSGSINVAIDIDICAVVAAPVLAGPTLCFDERCLDAVDGLTAAQQYKHTRIPSLLFQARNADLRTAVVRRSSHLESYGTS